MIGVDRATYSSDGGNAIGSGCGAGSQLVGGAFIGAIAGFIFATATGKSEQGCSAIGAGLGAVLLLIFGC